MINRDIIFDEIKNLQQPITSCQKAVIDYNNENFVYVELESAEMPHIEAQIEENVIRSTRKIGFPQRLQNCELFRDNKVNDDGDFIHFTLMAESEPAKTEETLSVPKWICAIKEELQSIEKSITWELVDLPDRKKSIGVRQVFKLKGNPKGEKLSIRLD